MGFKTSLMFRWTLAIILLVALIHIESSFAAGHNETSAEEEQLKPEPADMVTRDGTNGTTDSGADTVASAGLSALVIISVLTAAAAAITV